jgi:pimeloyl-ACP methyl ester carboxylesterase
MQKSFAYNNATIFYTVEGKGRSCAAHSWFWRRQYGMERAGCFLQNHFMLIVPDLPGTGQSGLYPDEVVTIEDYADCMHALLLKPKT